MDKVKELIEQLPPDLQQEALDFVEFLLEKRLARGEGELRLDWRGALRDLRGRYTSVELQHALLQWWGADVSP